MKVVGYSDRLSVQPGQTIRFMVSCELPSYRADVVRLIHGDDNPKGPGFEEEAVSTAANGEYPGRAQHIYSGSYVSVPDSPLFECPDGFTIQAWVRATTPQKGVQGVVTRWSGSDGYGLFIDGDGGLTLWVGDGDGKVEKVSTGRAMRAPDWYFVAGSYDRATGQVRLHQEPRTNWPIDDSRAVVESSISADMAWTERPGLLMGAYREHAGTGPGTLGGFFNGKIESPRLWARPLDSGEIQSLRLGTPPGSLGDGLVGSWDFSADISSSRVTDTSVHRLHGRTVNMPARGMTGHNWTGRHTDFTAAPGEYGAIHFHDGDLDDAGWETDFELEVPDGLRSGVYAARLQAGEDEDYVPFFVRPRRGTATERIVFLAPTNSYLAYANEHMATHPDVIKVVGLEPGEFPATPQDKYIVEQDLLSMYDLHTDGSGVCYSSRLRPIMNMRPKYDMPILNKGRGSPHQFNADLHLTDWMEEKGHRFDVVTDEDLHFEGADLLAPYRVVVTGSHPEYWSEQMLLALQAYLADGGRLMYMGGNGFYWVTSFDAERPHVIEIRRWGGTGSWKASPGEYHHSTTGELGGLWRNRNWEPQKMLGVGFTAQGVDANRPYRRQPGSRDPRAAFIFEGISDDELIGDFDSLVQSYGAAGFEVDRFDHDLGTPAHALLLAASFGHSDGYQHVIEEATASGSPEGGTVNPLVRADMSYFEGPKGGGVFSTASISWCGALSYNGYDNNVSRITDNVLTRFASDDPLG